MSEAAKVRGFGAALLVVGVALVVWTWKSVLATGGYSVVAGILGPACVVLGVGALVHAPPDLFSGRGSRVMTPYEWLAALVGVLHWLLLRYSEALGLVSPP